MSEPKIQIQEVSYTYGDQQVLRNITLDIPARAITVLFGPAGGGKTTLLRLINRLNDLVEDGHMTGRILLDGEDIYAPGFDVPGL
ncbi:MAG: ATP-binding cassette domain-containing protein, partial [Anaerolineae bacterium]